MRAGALALIGIAALAASVETVSARDGCGRGLFWDGYRCVPEFYAPPPPPPPGYYGGGDYGGRGYYGGGGYYEREYYGRDYYGGGPRHYRPDYPPSLKTNRYQDCYDYHGRRICCPKQFTVQDGVCKPYRGY